jgi:hypothetical protein
VTAPANGTAVINPDNTVTYTPDANFYGSDSFSYTISDGAGGSDTAVVTITVTPVNDAPVANDDVATTLQDTTVTIDVLANDSDVEGDALSVTAVTIPTNGSVVINPDNTVTYTPDASYSSTDSFSYTASDGNGGSDTAVVTITVTPVANACELYPIALPEDLLEDLEIGDYLDDILNGNQPGNFGWLTWAGSTNVPTLVASLTPPGNSHTYINPYDPNDHALSIGDWVRGKPGVSNASSVRDALEVLKTMNIVVPVWDNTGGEGAHAKYHVSAFALIRLIDYHLPGRDNIEIQFLGYTSCTEENTNPVANNDSIITSGNTAVTIDVLTNDTDMDNDVLAVLEVTQPAYGTAVINPAPSTGSGQATITYTPNASFIGDDTFYYTVSDGRGGTDTAVITVTVTPVAGNCELYPIALHEDILDDLDVGDVVRNIKNGNRDGEFGWLTWTGDKSLSVLVESLTTPGDSYTYINPYHPNDNIVSIGDWVWGKPGLSNTCSISHALTELESMDIVVPVWDDAASQCGNLKYHVSGYATIRLLDYSLNGMDKINIQFLGYVSCGE